MLDFGNDRGRLAEGAFRIEAHARWMNSDEVQADFAERFSVPVYLIHPDTRTETNRSKSARACTCQRIVPVGES